MKIEKKRVITVRKKKRHWCIISDLALYISSLLFTHFIHWWLKTSSGMKVVTSQVIQEPSCMYTNLKASFSWFTCKSQWVNSTIQRLKIVCMYMYVYSELAWFYMWGYGKEHKRIKIPELVLDGDESFIIIITRSLYNVDLLLAHACLETNSKV